MSKRLPSYWRLIPQRYNLIGSVCRSCNEMFFPQRKLCPNCRRKGRVEEIKFSGDGEIYSHTTIYAPTRGFEYLNPYIMAIVKLKEGPLITSQIVDCRPDDVRVGEKVRVVFRKIIEDGDSGIIRYGYKFKLID